MRDVFPDEKTDSSHSGEYPGGEAEAARIRDGLEGQQVCPFCGVVGDGAHAICDKCTMENSPIARKATKLRIGPWYVLQHRNPAAPGMKWETLLSFVRKGRVKPQSIVRGPTTHQLWRFAAHVKGLSREFGVCYSCGGAVEAGGNLCPHCNRLQEVPANPDTLLEGQEPEPRIPVYKEIQPPLVPPADEPELTIQPDPAIAAGAAEAAAVAEAEAEAEAEAVRRKVREQEEAFAREQREAIAREREAVEREKEGAAREKEEAGREREAVRREQEELARAREAVAREKETIENERAAVARQREAARRERESAASAAAALASAVSAVSAASIVQSSAPAEVDVSTAPSAAAATSVPVPSAQTPTQAAASGPAATQPSAPSTAAGSSAQPSTPAAASPAPSSQPPARPKPAAAADKSVWDIPESGPTRTPPTPKNQRPPPSAGPDKASAPGSASGARPRAQSARDGFLSARDLAAAFRLTHSPSADYDLAAHPADAERNADSFFPSEKPKRGSGLKVVLVILVLLGATAAAFAASKELRDRVMAAWTQLTDPSARPPALPRPAPTPPKDDYIGDRRQPDRSAPSAVPAPIPGPTPLPASPTTRPQTRPASAAPAVTPPVASTPRPSAQPVSAPLATVVPSDPAPSPAMLQEASDLLARAKGLEATDMTQAIAVLEKIEKFPRAAWPRGFEDELKEVRALRNLK